MFKFVPLFAAAVLVSIQCSREANALLERPKLIQHNNLESNRIPTQRRKTVMKYVTIKNAPPETVYNPETPLVLQCEVWSKPAPFVNWLKNGLPITDFEEDSNEIFSSHPSSTANMLSKLVINNVANGDVYTCVGTAGLNVKTASTTIYTDEDFVGLELPAPPIITASYGMILQDLGTSVTLPCRYYSATEAQVLWFSKNGKPVFDNSRMQVLPSGDLHINELDFDKDSGTFTCTVKNIYGTDTVSTFMYTTQKMK